jgi:hypothetical protein
MVANGAGEEAGSNRGEQSMMTPERPERTERLQVILPAEEMAAIEEFR